MTAGDAVLVTGGLFALCSGIVVDAGNGRNACTVALLSDAHCRPIWQRVGVNPVALVAVPQNPL
jgi:hypothetical protein